MALIASKVVTLSAESKIENVVVARLTSTVNSQTDVNSAYSEQILSTDAYNANKAAVRQDMDAFREMVYALEDELAAENPPAPVEPAE